MSEPKVGDFVLNYQRFTDEDDPLPPFLCRITRTTVMLYFVEHVNTKGIIKKRRINKGCCSSNSIDPESVMKDWKDYFSGTIRIPIKGKTEEIVRNRSVLKPRKRRMVPAPKSTSEPLPQRIRLKL
jgi:hypothetical protein